jgi:CPA1 family monovalent cation:H+ antiporter
LKFFSLISILISLAAVTSYLNYRYIKLPTTVGVMLVALIVSLMLVLIGPYAHGFREQATILVHRFDFNQIVLHGMLAFLLFAGAINVNSDELASEWLGISLLAVLGLLVSTFVVGVVIWQLLGWLGLDISFVNALLFGAIISPTDPIAVLGVMKRVGASRQLEAQVAGESLFNDGLGVVIFLMLLQFSDMDGSGSASVSIPVAIGRAAALLFKEVGGALVLALAAGAVAYQMLKRVDDHQVEVLITIALAMGLYALADALDLAAPIAVVIAGLLVGNHGREFAMTDKTRGYVDTFWELVDGILNIVLFLLIGLELLVLPIDSRWMIAGVFAIPVVLSARWLSVTSIIASLSLIKLQSKGAISVLTWGGLRGAISVAMALSLPESPSRSLILTLTYFVVVFSILVQGLTIGRVIRRAGGAMVDTQPSSRV